MKKVLCLTAMLIALLATGVGAERNGAIKIDFEPDVGWVVLNPTASGILIANAHLDNGVPNEEFMVSVRLRYEDQSTDIFQDVATLTTNRQGKGNVQVQVEIDPPEGSETLRRVAFRLRSAPDPLYVAVAWDIPLK